MSDDETIVKITGSPAEPAEAQASDAGGATSMQDERDELHNRWLRTLADFDNYRKRTERERQDLSEAVASDVLRDLLPIVDDLERALSSSAWQGESAARRGVELIHRQLLDLLRKRGVEPLDVVGRDFDPMWHEAVAGEPAGGRRDGEITAEVRRGYRIGSRLIRPAQVKVAKA
jgi:molecular chaperone GrpE